MEMFLEEKIKLDSQVSDQEIRAYYEEHKEDEFTNPISGETVSLSSVRENIRNFLVMEKQRAAFDIYMEQLFNRYVVRFAQESSAEEELTQKKTPEIPSKPQPTE
ncbi:MAG: hypothetical protein EYX74_05280 [Desulfobulbaceae bacterium]|nr:MAG: hypothetical protein EYX74_05280 [Desulfobulbaceae bacterium]